MSKTNEQIAMKTSWNTIIGNVALTVFKLAAGFTGRSAAMVSDAVHSLSDVLSTVIVMIGVKLSNQTADKEHPYGHERFESVTAIILAVILCATGLGIGFGGVKAILTHDYDTIASPGIIALAASIVSMVIKEAMYWYTRAAAKKIGSGAMMADAWHHRSDALSSVGSFAGILGARSGFPILDSVACLVICLFIVKSAIDIFLDAISKMTDRACDDETQRLIWATIESQENVLCVDQLKTRLFGDKIYVDVEIGADGKAPLHVGHDIAHSVHDAIEEQFPNVKHCMVHVNPIDGDRNQPAGI